MDIEKKERTPITTEEGKGREALTYPAAEKKMHPVVEFKTSKFDVSQEQKNPINPIYGESLLLWLREKVKSKIELPEPDYEDWGWYTDIEWKGRSYMLGASSDDGETWFFQIDKHRSLLEKLLGKKKITEEEEVWQYFINILKSEKDFEKIQSAT